MSDIKGVDKNQQEAQHLAQALEDPSSAEEACQDELAVAGLLRCAQTGGQLATDRQQTVWDQIQSAIEKEPPRVSRFKLVWWVPASALMTGLVIVILVWVWVGSAEIGLPSPSVALLHSQSEATTGSAKQVEALANEMKHYRRQMFAVLERKYEGPW